MKKFMIGILKIFLTITFPIWVIPALLALGVYLIFDSVSDLVDIIFDGDWDLF